MFAKYVYCRIFQISSPTDNPMSELNHAKIDWSRCSRNFIHGKIYPLKFWLIFYPSPSFWHFYAFFPDIFMLLPSHIFLHTLFQASKHFRDPLPSHVIYKSSLKRIYVLGKLKTLKKFESKKACEQNSRKLVTKQH